MGNLFYEQLEKQSEENDCDIVKENIIKFAQDQQGKMKPYLYKQWEEGYWAGMVDIIEYIERM